MEYGKLDAMVVWRGISRIDNKTPIVVIATGIRKASDNAKTGAMVQTWILRADMHPVDAVRTRADGGICGGCIHRMDANGVRSCYVAVWNAPASIYRCFARGGYAMAPVSALADVFAGKNVRLGSYGDPAAVPMEVWDAMLSRAAGWTGYTHQWKSARLRDVLTYCQASADSETDAETIVTTLGTGYFRVKPAGAPAMPGEIVCPASKEAGKVATCAECRMCDGSGAPVVIDAHGQGRKHVGRSRSLPVIG